MGFASSWLHPLKSWSLRETRRGSDHGFGAGPMPLHAGVSTPMIKILTAILSVFVVLTLGACLTAGTLPFRAVRGLVRSRALPA